MALNNTLVIHEGKCPPSCVLCVEACRGREGANGQAVLETLDLPGMNFRSVSTCGQCSQPECIAVCPSGALSRAGSGAVVLDRKLCVGCGICDLLCPYGGIISKPEERKVYKCDLCGDHPECAKACPHGVLTYEKAGVIAERLQEDLVSPGLPYCAGCGMELVDRYTLRVLGKNVILFGAPGCNVLGAKVKTPYYGSLMTNAVSSATGVSRFFKHTHRDTICLAIIGDGATADIGFGALSAAAERGERILYICYDNEAYMNTGVQRSGTTPLGSWTNTTQVGARGRGKQGSAKNVPLLMAFHQIQYVATATLAYPEDYMRTLLKAAEAVKEGMAYLHVLSPCPTGWKSKTEHTIEVTRVAVATNYFPLWEAERGVIRLTHVVQNRTPIQEFIKYMGRFSHLGEAEIQHFQQHVDAAYNQLRRIAVPE